MIELYLASKVIKRAHNMKNTLLHFILICFYLLSATKGVADNVSDFYRFAWSPAAGWLNFKADHHQVTIYDDHLEGYIWAENIGWIKVGTHELGGAHHYANDSATTYGVNNDGNGNLSGYAWGENIGWINFKAQHNQVVIDMTTGTFNGYAWSENIGWIHFNNASPFYKLQQVLDSPNTIQPAMDLHLSGILFELKNTPDIVGEEGLISITQEMIDGNLDVKYLNDLYYFRPVSTRTVNVSTNPPGISIDEDGLLSMITDQGNQITLLPEPQDIRQLQQASNSYGLAAQQHNFGMLKIVPQDYEETDAWFAARAAMQSQRIYNVLTTGFRVTPIDSVRYLVDYHFDKKGILYQQTLHPTPADWGRLKRFMQAMGSVKIDPSGYISLTIADKTYTGIMDYLVKPSSSRLAQIKVDSVSDVNQDSFNDFLITYPNGDQQILYLLNIQ